MIDDGTRARRTRLLLIAPLSCAPHFLLLRHLSSHRPAACSHDHLSMLLLICALTTVALGAETPEQRVPQALIIGVKKGGTRALLEYLRINDAIRAPGPEVHFFDRYYDRGIDWYRCVHGTLSVVYLPNARSAPVWPAVDT